MRGLRVSRDVVKRVIFMAVILVSCVGCDQATKSIAKSIIPETESWSFLGRHCASASRLQSWRILERGLLAPGGLAVRPFLDRCADVAITVGALILLSAALRRQSTE